jgi:PAS domain-containing protein
MTLVRTDVTRAVIRYGFALALSVAAVLVRLMFNPVVGHQMPFFLFWLATAIALWRVGIGPAIFAAILGAILGDYFFVEPIHTLFARPVEIVFVFEYLFICAITCLLGGLARRANARIRAASASTLQQKERVEKEVSDRKRSEAVLRGVLDSAPVGIWMLDGEGYITGSNAASDRIWGMNRPHGIYHINRCHGWWPETGQQLTAADWPAARALDQGHAVLDEEIEIETFDGTRKHALVSAVPLRDDRGSVT